MKRRVDELLVDRGFFKTREKAKKAIISGIVKIEGIENVKPGMKVDPKINIVVKDKKKTFPYVSRGGLKLEKAILKFNIPVKDRVALDIGASTGGFTDCLIQFGARCVYAVDVGYGQIDWELRNNPKVVVIERTNARYLSRAIIDINIDIVTIDVSFISVSKILPSLPSFLNKGFDIIVLIKPQFEAGKKEVRKGVIRDPDIHRKVINSVVEYAVQLEFHIHGLTFSPIKGPKGNIEFLAWFREDKREDLDFSALLDSVVEEAFKELM